MEITCSNCHSRFKLPDEKLPPGKTVNLKCPKCKHKIEVTRPKPKPPPAEEAPEKTISLAPEEPEAPQAPEKPASGVSTFGFDEDDGSDMDDLDGDMGDYDASEKPFDFVEEEGKTALICERDEEEAARIRLALDGLDYHCTVSLSTRDALKKMRYHTYDLILVNERFGGADPSSNGILIYLERLNMAVRRDIFVVMLSNEHRTMDNMIAFAYSVNMVVNYRNMDDLEKILRRGITDNDLFYRVFKETLKKRQMV